VNHLTDWSELVYYLYIIYDHTTTLCAVRNYRQITERNDYFYIQPKKEKNSGEGLNFKAVLVIRFCVIVIISVLCNYNKKIVLSLNAPDDRLLLT